MLRQVLGFFINGFHMTCDLARRFVLDQIGNVKITYFHFLISGILITLLIYLINYIKDTIEVENANARSDEQWYNRQMSYLEFREYQGWLRRKTKR